MKKLISPKKKLGSAKLSLAKNKSQLKVSIHPVGIDD